MWWAAPMQRRASISWPAGMRRTALAIAVIGSLLSLVAVPVHAAPAADPEMQTVLDALASLNGKPIETLSPDEARRQPTPADAVKKVLELSGKDTSPAPGVTIKEIIIEGPLGKLPLYVYTPTGTGPFPVMLYFHGGGFVMGSTQSYEASVRGLARATNAIIVSVEYHLAPEFKFPAAPDDAYFAYKWVRAHAAEFNGNPDRVAVGGESAGATLAAVVAMMARDKRETPPTHQLLIYPVLNNNMNPLSYREHANAKPLNRPMMEWFFKHYLARPDDAANPYALPARARTLRRLAPATIITADIDPLRSEGKLYAARLAKDGVKVNYRHYTGVTHEFFGMGAAVGASRDAEAYVADKLKKALGTQGAN